MSRLDREAGAAVPFRGRASVVGDRALAAELVEAPARLCAFVVEGLGELALLVERTPVAAVVNRLAEEGKRSTVRVEFRQLTEGQELRQHGRHDHRDRRAAGHVDHGLHAADEILDRSRVRRVRVGARDTAERGAGADRHDCGGALDRLHQHVVVAYAGDGRVAGVAHRDRAVDEHQVAAMVLFHRRATGLLGLFTGGRLQRVMVVEGDGVEHQPLDRGRCRACQRLGAARAFLEGQPDHRGPTGILDRLGDTRNHARRQGQDRGRGCAVLEEPASRHPLRLQDFPNGRCFLHAVFLPLKTLSRTGLSGERGRQGCRPPVTTGFRVFE